MRFRRVRRCILAAAATLALAAPVFSQTAPIDRTVLPIPPRPFTGNVAPGYRDSHPGGPLDTAPEAPKGAPNILVVLLDDAGYAQTSTFGGLIPTPTLDALARGGLRYTRFHVTPMCSPTRASLLTGRNHHAIGMGTITNWASNYPGYTGVLPKSAAFVSETLRANGYATAAIGKWHLMPVSEMTPAGPFDHWPTHQGFDYFYGFINAEVDQWHPQVAEGTTAGDMIAPPGRAGDYTLNEALADRAIAWIRSERSVTPDKPFFIYYAPGATHAPLQAPQSWIDRFRGKFDMGWDRFREQALARQKQLGVVPADTVLTPRPPELPAWDSLSPDEKKAQARLMETFAGYMAQSDHEIGRVIDTLRETGQLDNTLILFIAGDNGASQEGGLAGTTNSMAQVNHVPETTRDQLALSAVMGSAATTPMYSAGWAWAGNTPFQWGKRIGSHLGGTRDPLVVFWPKRIGDPGGVRDQYEHVIDIAPTLLDAAGIPQPRSVNGVAQQPVDGVSMLPTILDKAAPSARQTQYFEMLGNRSIYHDGWIAAQRTGLLPWVYGAAAEAGPRAWELYHLDTDYAEANDVAAQYPDRLKALQALFDQEARKYQVYPLDPRQSGRGDPDDPNAFHRTFYGATRLYNGLWPPIENRSYTITAHVTIPAGGANGAILAMGGDAGGFTLYMEGGRLVYRYNYFKRRVTTIRGPAMLKPGPATIELAFRYDGGQPGAGGNVRLSANGSAIGTARLPETFPFKVSFEDTFDIGEDSGSPVAAYRPPFRFTGRIEHVDVDAQPLRK